MTIRSYRGDAPAVAKVIRIPNPGENIVSAITIKINNKKISHTSFDAAVLADLWNNAGYPETATIVAEAVEGITGQYGTNNDTLQLTSLVPGEDFFVDAYFGTGDPSTAKTNEVQRIDFSPAPSGGTFTLSFDGQTTGAITFVADDASTTAANILAALEALSNIAPGDVTVTVISSNSFYVTFLATYAEDDVPLMDINYTNLTGGDIQLSVATIQNGVLPTNEVQSLVLPSTPTGGTFTLTFSGQTTGTIAYNATAATVDTALEALSNIGAGDVTCTGGPLPSSPVLIEFTGALAGANQPLITGDGALLTGGAANVGNGATVTQGGSGVLDLHIGWAYAIGYSNIYWRTVDKDGNLYTSTQLDSDISSKNLANIKAALVGMTVAYLVDAANSIYENRVITADDISMDDSPVNFFLRFSGSTGTFDNRDVNHTTAEVSGVAVPGFVGLISAGLGITVIPHTIYQNPGLTFEEQTFEVTNTTLSGQYTLTVYDEAGSPFTTAAIQYGATDQEIRDAINTALTASIVEVTTTVLGANNNEYHVKYKNYGAQEVNITQLIVNEASSVLVVEVTPGDAGDPEIQRITVSGSLPIRSGTFTITYQAQTTSAINFDDTNAEIDAALEALSTIAANEVTVSSAPISNGTVQITFIPSSGNVPQVTVTNLLTNAVAAIIEYIGGGLIIYTDVTTRNRGPECFDDPLNYDPSGLPSDGDTILYEFGQAACRWGIKQRDTFTVVSVTTNLLQVGTRRDLLQDGQKLLVTSTGTAPAGLSSGTAYFVVNSDGRGQFQLSTTLGGSAIDITDAGTGTHTVQLHLVLLSKPARYSFDIGLPRWNSAGFEEYRPRYLEAAIDTLTLGQGVGSDSSLVRVDTGAQATAPTIHNSGASAETDLPAVAMLINNNTSDIICYGGSVGLAPHLDESSTVRDITLHDTEFSSVGTTVCRNITGDAGSSLRGKFDPSGDIQLGI